MNNDTNTNETFIRTSPPLNRFVVKLGGPAPWDVLTAEDAREIARLIEEDELGMSARMLRSYADAVDAMTPRYPESDMQATVEDLGY